MDEKVSEGETKKSETAVWRAYVRIKDSSIYDRLKFLEDTKNIKIGQAIYESLFYGLEPYIKAVFGEIDEEDTNIAPSSKGTTLKKENGINPDERIDEIVNLLEEIVLNTTLIKSMAASMFNERLKNLYGYSVRPDLFESGALRDTPKYLEAHEKMITERLGKSRRERQSVINR